MTGLFKLIAQLWKEYQLSVIASAFVELSKSNTQEEKQNAVKKISNIISSLGY